MIGKMRQVLSKPAVQTGLVLGAIAAVRTYQPSLVDRSRNDQALIVAGSIASGYVAGNAFERLTAPLGSPSGVGRLVASAGVAAAAAAASKNETPPPVETAATVVGAAAAVSGVLGLARRIRPAGTAGAVLQGAAVTAALSGALARQLRSYADDGKPAPAPAEIGTSAAAGAAITASAWGLLAAERSIARAISRAGSTYLGGPRLIWQAAAHAALLGSAAIAGKTAARRALASFDHAGDRIEPGYSTPPVSSLVSGSPASAVDYSELGVQGRRFVTEAATAETINDVMGTADAFDAIRLYVGVDSAANVDERVELAITELRRTDALERSMLIVGSPAGTGYLNYIPVEAAEYFTAGDVATITIQYGKRPSLLSIDRIDVAQQQYLTLVERIAGELARRPESDRPRVVLYGESLGAQTGQDAFPQPGYDALADRFVDNALWVGTPYPTRFRRTVMSVNPRDERFERFATMSTNELDAQYCFLDHHEDPVTRFNSSILFRRPPWLGPAETRPPNISRTQQWVPAVTFLQSAVDTKNAARVVPGEFKAFGHDYRADLAEFVRGAYAISGVTDDQMKSVEAKLRRSEIERAARIAEE